MVLSSITLAVTFASVSGASGSASGTGNVKSGSVWKGIGQSKGISKVWPGQWCVTFSKSADNANFG
jgi:hypothetical protein